VSSFYDKIFQVYLNHRPRFQNPVIWTSTNTACLVVTEEPYRAMNAGVIPVNQQLGNILRDDHVPYFDNDLLLRTHENCPTASDDGRNAHSHCHFSKY